MLQQSALLSSYISRVTDKTGGVLTLAGVVFAVATFVIKEAGDVLNKATQGTPQLASVAFLFCIAAIILSSAGMLILCTNFLTVWRENLKPSGEDFKEIFFLFARRARRLQLALYCLMVSAGCVVIALVLLEWPMFLRAIESLGG